MANINRNWNGRLYGTNTGNLAVSLEGSNEALTGVARFNDTVLGLVVYRLAGTFTGSKLSLEGTVYGQPQNNVEFGVLTITGELTPLGSIVGEWTSTIGSGGTFELYPHNQQRSPNNSENIPEQLYASTRTVGAIRLYADDIRNLINQIIKDFTHKKAVITYHENGNERSVYSEDFYNIHNLQKLKYLKISIQEHEAYGINKNVTIELSSNGINTIRTQSVQESWASGKATNLHNYLKQFEQFTLTHYRKYGIALNLFILVGAISALPGLSTYFQRVGFSAVVVMILFLFAQIHNKFIYNFEFDPNKKNAEGLDKWGGQLAVNIVSSDWNFNCYNYIWFD
ncbi:hypothetical protein [Glycocaulis sp.]|uniref:hypothetical protein n=1 Tax=Glycocaulis sp. TaxID=1969725 RepID=UPI003D25DAB3